MRAFLPRLLQRATLFTLLCLLALKPALADSAPAAESPDDVIREASQDILAVIDAHRATFDSDPDSFYDAVDARMKAFVDYRAIAKAVMAQYWADASEAQRDEFVKTFRRGLVHSYARALLEFDQQSIKVLPMEDKYRRGNRALVRMQVVGSNGKVYPLQYSMALDDDGHWRVRNVIVDGVNLGLTYRNQFASAMQSSDANGDLDKVIANWTLSTDGSSNS